MVKLSEETIYRKDDVIELRCEVRILTFVLRWVKHSFRCTARPCRTRSFGRKVEGPLPTVWLRDACVCRSCSETTALRASSRFTASRRRTSASTGAARSTSSATTPWRWTSPIETCGRSSVRFAIMTRHFTANLVQNVEGLPPKVSVGIILALVLLVLCVVLLCCYSLRRGRRNKAKGSGFSGRDRGRPLVT